MCHLTGIISETNVIPEILNILESQEAIIGAQATGLAILKGNKIIMDKNIGPVKKFKKTIPFNEESTIGIGHTRYAFKIIEDPKANTREKAHPFWDSKQTFTTMHNGTISNYTRYVENLERKGYQFTSKSMYKNTYQKSTIDYCDSEIFSYLLEEELNREVPIKQAIRNACSGIEGHFAFVVLHPNYPDTIFLANWMQPMFLGVSKTLTVFSSFREGLLPLKDKIQTIFEPPKNVLITLEKGKITIENLLFHRNIPSFNMHTDLFEGVILEAITNDANDLAGIWNYIQSNPNKIGLSFQDYEKLSTIQGFTFSPLIYESLQKMENTNEIIRKLEYVEEGGVELIPRYKFYKLM